MDPRHLLGQNAEIRAEDWFLSHRPSKLLARNFRCRSGEIDLVFEEVAVNRNRRTLVFVEVRARSQKSAMGGAQSLNWKKQQSLTKTIQYFLLKYRGPAMDLRVDLLYWDGSEWSHLPNIWLLDAGV